MSTGESATQELEKGTAIISATSFPTSHPPSGSASAKTISVHPLSGVSEEEGDEKEHLGDELEGPNAGEFFSGIILKLGESLCRMTS